MDTEEGRRQYMLNIQQIAQSVQETNNYDVLATLLNCREYERKFVTFVFYLRTSTPSNSGLWSPQANGNESTALSAPRGPRSASARSW